jgi:hypothetical protein
VERMGRRSRAARRARRLIRGTPLPTLGACVSSRDRRASSHAP